MEDEIRARAEEVKTWDKDKLDSLDRVYYKDIKRGDLAVFDNCVGVFLDPTYRFNNPNVILTLAYDENPTILKRYDISSVRRYIGEGEVTYRRYPDDS